MGPKQLGLGDEVPSPNVQQGPETVPLEPISPVRNALRPRRLPTAAALRSRPLRGLEECSGSAFSARHNIAEPPPAPQTAQPGQGLRRSPRPASARSQEKPALGPRSGPGPSPRPEPRGLTRGRPEWTRRGCLFCGTSESISVPGGARGQRSGQSSSGFRNGSRPYPHSRSNLLGCPLYLQALRAAAAQGCGRAGPSLGVDGKSRRKRGGGSLDPPRCLSAGAGVTEGRGPDCCFPERLLRSSGWTAAPGNQCRNCHSPPPSAPLSPPPPPTPSSRPSPPRPAPPGAPLRLRAVRHGVAPTRPAAGVSGTRLFVAQVLRVLEVPGCTRAAWGLGLSPSQGFAWNGPDYGASVCRPPLRSPESPLSGAGGGGGNLARGERRCGTGGPCLLVFRTLFIPLCSLGSPA